MSRILIRWVINGVALAVATWLVPGITIVGEPRWLTLVVVAAIFGLVNTLISPVIKVLSCPLMIVTLGLFTLVVNGLMLWLTAWIGDVLDVGFLVDGFWPAFLGALVVSLVSFLLGGLLVRDKDRERRSERR
jgi:putative membrane protein